MSDSEDLGQPAPSTHAERLLGCFRKACNHDLSNQMVALQGMLHLLHEEERQRLSEAGQDYLRRAAASARRAVDMVQTLKDLTRWAACAEKTEQIALADLLQNVQIELSRLYSERTVEYDLSISAPAVTAGRRGLFRALVELGRLGISVALDGPVRLQIGSSAHGGGIDLRIGLDKESSPIRSGAPGFQGLEGRFEFVLARELASAWNAALLLDDRGPAFVLRFA